MAEARHTTGVDLDGALLAARPDVIRWRRHLHRHPELSGQEHATAAYLADELGKLGLDTEQPTPTSVSATLHGARPGRCIAVRADIDALPIQEQTDLPFASEAPGVMHACGHDGHAAVVLGVAMVLGAVSDQLAGSVKLLFQHAEERPPQGALDLIAAGVLDDVDVIIGEHLWAPLPLGTIGVAHGAMMGSVDNFDIRFCGAGGHAALPHETRDPILAAADFVTSVQRVISRETDPRDAAVISVTSLRAGDAANIIPSETAVGGTARALTAAGREAIRTRIDEIAQGIAALHRLEATVDFEVGPPPLINAPPIVDALIDAAWAQPGVTDVDAMQPILGADDFASYLERVPGAYMFVGAGSPGTGGPFPHHHPRFTIREEALAIATGVLARAAVRLASDPPGGHA